MSIQVTITHNNPNMDREVEVDVHYREADGRVQETPLRTHTIVPGGRVDLLVYSRQVLVVREAEDACDA